jgi:DNA-binding IclR family transcriptional regulator
LRVGAAGKLLLAFADRGVQDAELRRARDEASAMPNAPGAHLGEQLDQIREGRWATSVGEREEGVSAVATPVMDSRNRVVAALCISAPTTRLGPDQFEQMRRPLVACAAEVSSLLQRG